MASGPSVPASPVGSGPRPGVLLNDRYRLLGAIGAGGMATVWAADDEVLGRRVAVKLAATREDADLGARLRHEARTAAKLRHDDIVRIYDYGEDTLDAGEDPVPFIVMELLSGRTLHERLASGAPPLEEGVAICTRVAAAVAAAHRAGVVHRDINPRNIMLTADGVTVLDFGISFTQGARTSDGSVLGTRGYVAPEVLRGRASDKPADVYALGVLIDTVIAPSDPTVRDIVARCTARDPARRPSASAVARLLRSRHPGADRWAWFGTAEQSGWSARLRGGAATTRFNPITPRAVALATRRVRVRPRTAARAAIGAGIVACFLLGAALANPQAAPIGRAVPLAERSAPADIPAAVPTPSPGHDSAPELDSVPGSDLPVGTALDATVELVDDGEADGRVRSDVALDLRQVIEGLRDGTAGPEEIAALREKVELRAAEDGALDPEHARLILETLPAA